MESLKKELIKIRENDYDFTNYDLNKLSLKMIDNIGTTDSELRDGLIYNTFGHMILLQDLLNPKQLYQLLKICLDDEHLFNELGEKGTDSVFARSFSVLVLGLIIDTDHRNSFLTEVDFKFMKNQLFNYVLNENDIRGYVDGKGWAHSLAHAVDALIAVVNHPQLTEDELIEILDIIKTKILCSDYVYNHGEDERMALLVSCVLQRRLLDEYQILNWIGDLNTRLKEQQRLLAAPNELYLMINVRNFLFSLYFRLRFENIGTNFQEKIEKILDSIREF